MHIFLKNHETFHNPVPKPVGFVLFYYTFFSFKIEILFLGLI